MKKFVIRVSLFLLLVICLDLLAGGCFALLRRFSKKGSTAQNEYIANECTPDIVILGSSRAEHHYVPSVLSEELGLSCYNCGKDGNGIYLAYARLQMIMERCTPKIVIYDLTPDYDYLQSENDAACFPHIKPYYDHDGAKQIVNALADPEEKLMMYSRLYRNNSRLVQDVSGALSLGYETKNGYIPLSGTMKKAPAPVPHEDGDPATVDPLKYQYLEDLIRECKEKGIFLVFSVSPYYSGILPESYDVGRRLAEENGIPFLDHSGSEGISGTLSLFQDKTHMNDRGAVTYSRIVAEEIRSYLGAD